MPLAVIPQVSELAQDRSRGKIVVESDCTGPPFSDSFQELEAIDARNLALAFASQCGMASPMINGNLSSPYPVNVDGVPLDQVAGPGGAPLPPTHPKMQPFHYRIDVPVARPIR